MYSQIEIRLQTCRKQKFPGWSQQQFSKGKKHSRELQQEKLQGNQKCIIIDDGTYCKLDCSTLPGQQFYTIPKRTKPDVLLKAIKTEKFGKKVMVWLAIC